MSIVSRRETELKLDDTNHESLVMNMLMSILHHLVTFRDLLSIKSSFLEQVHVSSLSSSKLGFDSSVVAQHKVIFTKVKVQYFSFVTLSRSLLAD